MTRERTSKNGWSSHALIVVDEHMSAGYSET
jgi:hypothetical protein